MIEVKRAPVAPRRHEQAAARARAAGAALYPEVNVLARGGGKFGGDASGLHGVGAFLSWEPDLWEPVRAASAAGERQ